MLRIHYFIYNVKNIFYCLLITKNRSSVSLTQCIPIARYELPGTIEVYVNHVTIERFELPSSQLCFLYIKALLINDQECTDPEKNSKEMYCFYSNL